MTRADLEALRTESLNSGWPSDRVAAMSFLDPVGSNRDHAVEVGIAAQKLLERSGAEKIDVAGALDGRPGNTLVHTHTTEQLDSPRSLSRITSPWNTDSLSRVRGEPRRDDTP